MPSPTSDALPNPPLNGAGTPPLLGARVHLDGGLRYEQAGLGTRAIAAYEAALAAGGTAAERAEAHLRLARVYRSLCQWDDAVRESRDAVRLAEGVGEEDLVAEAMNVEVGVWQLQGKFPQAESLARAALAHARTPRVRGILLQNLGAIAAQQREFPTAERLFSESVSAFEEASYTLGIGIALNNASAAARDGGDAVRALELGSRAEAVAREVDALDIFILAIQNRAHALVDLGRLEEAETLLGEALGHFSATRNELRQAECLEIMGQLHALRADHRETAIRCYERALDLAARVGDGVLGARVEERLRQLR